MGSYTPSAGTIYPRLAALEGEGLIEHQTVDGRKVYRLTDAGQTALISHREDIEQMVTRAVTSTRALARDVRDEVRVAVRELRRRRLARDPVRSLQAELDTFVADIAAAATEGRFDRRQLRLVRARLDETRDAIHEIVTGEEEGR